MKLPSDVRKYLAENRVEAVRLNNGHFYNINDDIPEPAGPLIKDEKIRKAVRAWAEANGEEDNIVFTRSCEYSDYMFYTNGGGDICFEQGIDLTTGSYTIAELCGEEEE